MKHLRFGMLLVSIALGVVSYAQNTKAPHLKFQNLATPDREALTEIYRSQAGQAISKPGKGNYYDWDSLGASWELSYKVEFTFSNTGDLEMEVYKDPVFSMPILQATYTYHTNGEMLEETQSYWDGSSWVPSDRTRNVYDSKDNLIETAVESHNGTNWEQIDGEKNIFTYNAQGHRTEWIHQTFYGQYDNDTRTIYTVNSQGGIQEQISYWWDGTSWQYNMRDSLVLNGNNEPTEIYTFMWTGFGWEPSSRMINIQWHDYEAGEYLSYIEQISDGIGGWVNNISYLATYTATGVEDFIEIWNGGSWDYSARTITEVDAHGNFVQFRVDGWNGIDWEPFLYLHATNTYSPNDDLLETVMQFWNPNTQSLYNMFRYTFSDFVYFFPVGMPEVEQPALNVFPNPATDVLRIGTGIGEGSYQILNTNGQVVRQGVINCNAQINIADLAPSMYILQWNGADRIGSTTFIKQ